MYGSAMEGYELLGFVGILKECLKILSKNGKLMATITTISILLNSLLFFTNIFFTNLAVRNLIAKETLLSFTTNPNSSDISKLFIDIMREIQIIIKVQLTFMLPSLIVSLFSMASFVLASAVACCGYFFLFSAILISLGITCIDHPLVLLPIVLTLGVFSSIFLIYLMVVWELGSVISVIEENCYGIEALGKASELVKGKRLLGFALNFLFTLIMALEVCSFTMIRNDQKWVSTHIVIVFLLIGFNGLAMMLLYMSFTVLYFQCKKIHGEEIELQGSLEYSKIPSNHLVAEDLP
ncbi:Dol-P-Glc:Glc(2)Man(9)GlcNAc(2)-PP-Dol alpha-1,2-glucosyltransferase [Actinidia chinensis var. chinensis]|uniref:Dol-P-Glc:Glc(2)Man(9)GlcNAc(2)-PP-Dol alpha-1,2-glucosyltransferase n=1 Tax=Actinidia chinensis var. chinensis TaxID=1590841 RepID=A0A2R6QI95_ACTCC|nr:Dol-P-Glc:Glc(2)Man(9)GlcNAc(2)-PP-Dol alpha-1,2-glucosyltransferase [Actinidia chinensis var. chinensis]